MISRQPGWRFPPPCSEWRGEVKTRPAEEGGRGQLQIFVTRMEVPRPALRGEGEVKNPARRSPGGRRMEPTFHQKPLLSFEFLVFITLQLLRPAEAVIRNHTLLVDSRVKMGAKI